MIVSLRSGFAACDSAAVLIVTPNAPLSVTLVTISAIAWLATVRE
jgi:hypothetical protein